MMLAGLIAGFGGPFFFIPMITRMQTVFRGAEIARVFRLRLAVMAASMLVFNLGATPLFDLIGPTHTEFSLGLLLLALGVGGYLYFRRGSRAGRKIFPTSCSLEILLRETVCIDSVRLDTQRYRYSRREERAMAKAFPTDNPFLHGYYGPVNTEADAGHLHITGEMPKELCGTLYRNGPNPQFAPRGPYHWFGGDGMIHAFHIENGNVSYKNRWVRTPKWEIENKEGEGLSGTFGNPRYTDPRVMALNSTIANTNIVWHGGKLLALEEAHAPFSLDPASLMPVERRLRDLRRQAQRPLHRPSQDRSQDRRDGVLRLLGQGPLHQGSEHPDRDGRRQGHARRDPRRPLPQHDPRLRGDAGTGSCCRSSRSPRRWSAPWAASRPSPGSPTRARTSPSSRATAPSPT